MKCPKCGYFGPDSLNTCKKCGKELFAEKAKLGLSSSKTRSFKPRPIPQKEPAPPSLIPEALISAYPLQEKTSPLFTNEPPELLIVPPPVEPKIKKQDFSTEPFEMKFEEQEKTFGGELKTAFSFETKHGDTLPLATRGEDSRNIKMPPNDVEDFKFPEDLTKTPPSLSGLSSNEELFLPDEPGQEKINLSMDDISLHEKTEKKEGEQELLGSEERKKILRMKNPLQDQSPREAPPGRIKTEPLDDEEIARILEDINPGPSEPGTTT
jgi:hypothetical protein